MNKLPDPRSVPLTAGSAVAQCHNGGVSEGKISKQATRATGRYVTRCLNRSFPPRLYLRYVKLPISRPGLKPRRALASAVEPTLRTTSMRLMWSYSVGDRVIYSVMMSRMAVRKHLLETLFGCLSFANTSYVACQLQAR